jgi:hypothetical protein
MIHSQMRLKLDPPDGAGELLAGVGGGAVLGTTVGLAGLGVGDGGPGVGDGGAVTVAGALTLGEDVATAPLALCTHAAARHPVTRMAVTSSTRFTRRRIPALPRV